MESSVPEWYLMSLKDRVSKEQAWMVQSRDRWEKKKGGKKPHQSYDSLMSKTTASEPELAG